MWELISINKRNSAILLTAMAILLLLLGVAVGLAFGDPIIGLVIAAAIWLVLTIVSFAGGDKILLASSGATPVTKEVHPQLFNVVEEMKIAASLPHMPRIYIIDDASPNAFATGRKPENASIAVTSGLLATLNRDELQGVIAHEMSHILHRDILYVTLAGIMLGAIVMLADIVFRAAFYGGRYRSSRSSRSGKGGQGGAQAIMLLIGIVAAILAPIFAHMLYFALSRSREYLADAGAVRLTRYPEGLASALEKISGSSRPMASANKATAPMFIVNPLQSGRRAFSGLGSTHPPIDKRIEVLRKMTHGAGYKDFAQSYAAVYGKKPKLPQSMLDEKQPVAIRAATVAVAGAVQPPTKPAAQKHAADDIVRKAGGYAFATCDCGLKLKIPPALKGKPIKCPRCARMLPIPA